MKISEKVNLGKKSTLGVGAEAEFFCEVKNKEKLLEAFSFAKEKNLEILPLGLGSNLFFANPLKKLVVKVGNKDFETFGNGIFKVGAGEVLGNLISKLAKENFDLSGLTGFPSTLGGAVVGNAGLLGNEIKDFLISAEIFDFETGEFEIWKNEDFKFDYRYSVLKGKSKKLVWTCELKVPTGEKISEKVAEINKIRWEKQPQGRSAGSFFKNPPGDYAGRLIEEVGLKGYKIGGAFFSEKHANFLMTEKNAKLQDIIELKELAKKKVKESFGVDLEEEVLVY